MKHLILQYKGIWLNIHCQYVQNIRFLKLIVEMK